MGNKMTKKKKILVTILLIVFVLLMTCSVLRRMKARAMEDYEMVLAVEDKENRQTKLVFIDSDNLDTMWLVPLYTNIFPYSIENLPRLRHSQLATTFYSNVQNNSTDSIALIMRSSQAPTGGQVVLIDGNFNLHRCPFQRHFWVSSPISLIDSHTAVFVDSNEHKIIEYDYRFCIAKKISEEEPGLSSIVISNTGDIAKVYAENDPTTDEKSIIKLSYHNGKEVEFLGGIFPAFSHDGEYFTYMDMLTRALYQFSLSTETVQEITLPENHSIVNLAWGSENDLLVVLYDDESQTEWVYRYAPDSETWLPLVELPAPWFVRHIQRIN